MYVEQDDGIILLKPDTVADASLLVWLAERFKTETVRFELMTHSPVSVIEMGLEIESSKKEKETE